MACDLCRRRDVGMVDGTDNDGIRTQVEGVFFFLCLQNCLVNFFAQDRPIASAYNVQYTCNHKGYQQRQDIGNS